MPRKKDPLAELKGFEAREAELKERKKALQDEAARYLGSLVMDAGLDSWNPEQLREGLVRLAAEGPDRSDAKAVPTRPASVPNGEANEQTAAVIADAPAAGSVHG
ncbi:DUF6437 family protein [Parvularcula sp. LCG005]|uniref:DUF6437 family protein n=1 Tax=Parvularcula sp. LCG005 TaxID=3078805 RepID=UPI0029433C0E|nr:DUF6437 family protein [Parvularcula sp. LCG005]WOI52225.1 DUF6437 family protein [Parvularcula sp. LCG005]